jgi:hypothetical protein
LKREESLKGEASAPAIFRDLPYLGTKQTTIDGLSAISHDLPLAFGHVYLTKRLLLLAFVAEEL